MGEYKVGNGRFEMLGVNDAEGAADKVGTGDVDGSVDFSNGDASWATRC